MFKCVTATWTKLAPSCLKVAPKMGHDIAKIAILSSVSDVFGWIRGAFLEHFGRWVAYQKPLKNDLFLKGFLRFWRG
jgi:hypothetical protein